MIGNLIGTVRRNHALEHATIAVLLRRIGHDVRMVGRATGDGYYLYADVPTELLEESTHEALRRMQQGEGYLAVSPFCGTNLAVAGAMAGIASVITMGSGRRGEKLPNVILASMLAVLAPASTKCRPREDPRRSVPPVVRACVSRAAAADRAAPYHARRRRKHLAATAPSGPRAPVAQWIRAPDF
jgi:hypothetical protein